MLSQLKLPPPPESETAAVKVWTQPVRIPTYHPLPPSRQPMFLENRVYQGSSGRVYPLPFYDRISEERVDHEWGAIHIENEYLRIMILPEIGGRIHVLRDKVSGEDLIYRQDVIKPALVGLAGPWISGGIEFNWPQHHRPATYMGVRTRIERSADGTVVVWFGDHDPMTRMAGVHGVSLSPGVARMDVHVNLHNRTVLPQTFLWWANMATRVHEEYQSFFPKDVTCIADHARRAMSSFPRCDATYYGVAYAKRGRDGVPIDEQPAAFRPPGSYPADDLSWYANIPTPCSYMALGSRQDFFGGYDHKTAIGIVHIADHRISPGKKQWTWGNHEFGYAWDRNLTDPGHDGVCHPYIELMAGVYTDNQPDFSFLAPGETRRFVQSWWPLRQIGVATSATKDVASRFVRVGSTLRIGICVARRLSGASIRVPGVLDRTLDFRVETPFHADLDVPTGTRSTGLVLEVRDADGTMLLRDQLTAPIAVPIPPAATEPSAPRDIPSADELYLTGVHLAQYRHATRAPDAYWREALRRDPLDSRCNTAIGNWHLQRGEFSAAESCFRTAIARLTARNANPRVSEAHYGLGLALRYLGRHDEAYDAWGKAAWNAEWQTPAKIGMAELDAAAGRNERARQHLSSILCHNAEHLHARNLMVLILRRLGQTAEAQSLLGSTRSLAPLDAGSAHLAGEHLPFDAGTCIDLAIDYGRAGEWAGARKLLSSNATSELDGRAPMLLYHQAWIDVRSGHDSNLTTHLNAAQTATSTYCFPSLLEDLVVLEFAVRQNPKDASAWAYLGHWLYDRRRHAEAFTCWENSHRHRPNDPVVCRNLGLGYLNIKQNPKRATAFYERAWCADRTDARIFYERDQLAKRLAVAPARRLKDLLAERTLIARRDDLTVELSALFNQTGRSAEAASLLESRRFQPWEGGEGMALGQHVRTHMLLARAASAEGDLSRAVDLLRFAKTAPHRLGEARHLLANASDLHYRLGCALEAAGDKSAADSEFKHAADAEGDFRDMSVHPYGEMTVYSALAAGKLKRRARQRALLNGLVAYARTLRQQPARIDYFATSLPTMLLFEDDLKRKQLILSLLLEGQALWAMGREREGKAKLRRVLKLDPSHAAARDLLEWGF